MAAQMSRPRILKKMGKRFLSFFGGKIEDCGLFEIKFKDERERDSILTELMAADGERFSLFAHVLPRFQSDRFADRLLEMVCGLAEFSKLPINARQTVLKCQLAQRNGLFNLSDLFLLFYRRFGGLREPLEQAREVMVAQSCFKIMLGIECVDLYDDGERQAFCESICKFYPQQSLVGQVFGLQRFLMSNSSISSIVQTFNRIQSSVIKNILAKAIQESCELVTANAYMGRLKQPCIERVKGKKQPLLLFNRKFLQRHGLTKEQQLLLLQDSTIESHLSSLLELSNFDDIDGELVVSLTQQRGVEEWCQASADNLILLYHFDDSILDKRPVALEQVFPSTIIQLVLGIRNAKCLGEEKRVRLLRHLGLHFYADLLDKYQGDREGLLANFFDVIFEKFKKQMLDLLDELDYQTLLKLVLRDTDLHSCIHLFNAYPLSTALCVIEFVGCNTKLLESFKLPINILSDIFLLADDDVIVEHVRPKIASPSITHIVESKLSRSVVVRALKRSKELASNIKQTAGADEFLNNDDDDGLNVYRFEVPVSNGAKRDHQDDVATVVGAKQSVRRRLSF